MYRLIVIMYGIYPSEPMPIAYPTEEACVEQLQSFVQLDAIAERIRNEGWKVECVDRFRYLELKYSQ